MSKFGRGNGNKTSHSVKEEVNEEDKMRDSFIRREKEKNMTHSEYTIHKLHEFYTFHGLNVAKALVVFFYFIIGVSVYGK